MKNSSQKSSKPIKRSSLANAGKSNLAKLPPAQTPEWLESVDMSATACWYYSVEATLYYYNSGFTGDLAPGAGGHGATRNWVRNTYSSQQLGGITKGCLDVAQKIAEFLDAVETASINIIEETEEDFGAADTKKKTQTKGILSQEPNTMLAGTSKPTFNIWAASQMGLTKAQAGDKFKAGRLSNLSAEWQFASIPSKVTPGGRAMNAVCLSSGHGLIMFGLVKNYNGGVGAYMINASPKGGIRVSKPFVLSKADSYCLEIDIEPKTGRTNVLINDVGYDMGVMKGFKRGASTAMFVACASKPGDHLLSGSFSNCAIARAGQWEKAEFNKKFQNGNLQLHQEAKMVACDSIAWHDRRSDVV